PIIMNFGLARLMSDEHESLTVDASMLGTPGYMAPEQIDGALDIIGPRTDVYGLGIILYELLTGNPPFRGALGAVLVQAKTTMPVPPSSLVPTVNARVEAACMRALAKDPSDRFATMADFAEALEAVSDA